MGTGDPFRIALDEASRWRRFALAAASPVLTWLLRLPEYRRLYASSKALPGAAFEDCALAALGIQPVVADADRTLIPAHGPLIVAANHPHGVADGLLVASIVKGVRPDVRVLANHLLARIPEMRDLCFFVDPFDGPPAIARSRSGLRAARRWLSDGGALIVFPAGEVAHTPRSRDGDRKSADTALPRRYQDSAWKPTVGRLARSSGAAVMPAFIDGANSALFYAAGRVHPALRTALLGRECLKARGRSISVRFGPVMRVSAGETSFGGAAASAAVDAAQTTQAIRRAVERLGERAVATPNVRSVASGIPVRRSTEREGGSRTDETAARAAFTPSDAIAAEIARLPADACLVESGTFRVFSAEARQIPATLREIGRRREIAYRAIGEGTGRQLDLDAYDEHYLHLFSWDRERRQIAGAYRIGQTDRLTERFGIHGLYTRTLFRYDERLMDRLSPALELGRSFIAADYQRNYSALLLLWKGIGQFVVRHPAYRVLFGPVSISTRYSDSSHRLLMSFLHQNHRDESLAELVQALHPKDGAPAPAPVPVAASIPASIDEANRLVSQLEADGKGVPVLLRQYLKLNARLIGFNVDPDFGDALDALMMVDLTRVDRAILTRYLGRDGARAFLAHHAVISVGSGVTCDSVGSGFSRTVDVGRVRLQADLRRSG